MTADLELAVPDAHEQLIDASTSWADTDVTMTPNEACHADRLGATFFLDPPDVEGARNPPDQIVGITFDSSGYTINWQSDLSSTHLVERRDTAGKVLWNWVLHGAGVKCATGAMTAVKDGYVGCIGPTCVALQTDGGTLWYAHKKDSESEQPWYAIPVDGKLDMGGVAGEWYFAAFRQPTSNFDAGIDGPLILVVRLRLATGEIEQEWKATPDFRAALSKATSYFHPVVTSILPNEEGGAIVAGASIPSGHGISFIAKALPDGSWKDIHAVLPSLPVGCVVDLALNGSSLIGLERQSGTVHPKQALIEIEKETGFIVRQAHVPGRAYVVGYNPPEFTGRLRLASGERLLVTRLAVLPSEGGPPNLWTSPEVLAFSANFDLLWSARLPDSSQVCTQGPIIDTIDNCGFGVHFGAYYAHLTPWGHTSAQIAGACATKSYSDCLDQNPCTADLCSPAVGCIHPNVPDGAPCGAGRVCKGGTCS